MQILILAAGESSRFWPFSEFYHKSLLKIGSKTILERVINNLNKNEIILVMNPKTEIPENILKRKNVTIIKQEEPKGMDDAILKARNLIKDEFLVVMPYYINIADCLKQAAGVKAPAIAVKKYENGEEKTHGIARIENGKITEIREKQKFENGDYSIIGIYKLNKEIINRLDRKSNDGYNFEAVLNELAETAGLNYFMTEKLPSLKYVTDLLSIRELIYDDDKNHEKTDIYRKSDTVFIEKTVLMGKNVKLGNNVSLKGKTIIGSDSFIGDNVLIRDSILGEGTKIGFGTEIARSIIMDNTHIHSGFIGDSVIGKDCRIGAAFITGNRRIDRKTIKITVKSEEYDTGLTHLGVVMGNNVKTGINTSIMPGTIIGNNSIIGSNTEVNGRIESNKLVYSKKEIVEKQL
jgi:bifunctional UDP-N-acetylglucosamine pyrophosphorylase/glucosamine-1-phosphate N-acetyltransferase